MKHFLSFLVMLIAVNYSYAQNAPLFLWGTGLDGSTYQKTAIYSDTSFGLLFEAPLDAAGVKLPIEFNWRGSGVTPLRINPNGNVGIGTNTPSFKLDVVGVMHSNVSSGNNLILSKSTGASLAFDDGSSTQTAMIEAGTSDNHLEFFTNTSTSTGLVERMRILNNGNVGIGTTNPAEKATVTNTDPQALGIYRDLDVNIVGRAGTFLNFGAKNGSTLTPGAQIVGVLSSTATTGALSFCTLTSGSLTPKMSIDDSGKVGIGTTTPDELLSVNGTIHSKEVKVNLTGLPDYVFKPDYHLPTLSEVKSYIDKNGHLSEIPSALEVEKNGLNLGDMNKLLLKKVEELTLYLIEKDKQINDLKQKQQSEIDELRKQMQTMLKNKP